MISTTGFDVHIDFRSPAEKQPTGPGLLSMDDDQTQQDGSGGNRIVCRTCHTTITSKADSIPIQGSHEHTFANPDGVLFQIGCFRNAPGCQHIGGATEKWSWFKGFRWKVALCSGCASHLGWLYLSSGGDQFYGLIFDRLLFPADDA